MCTSCMFHSTLISLVVCGWQLFKQLSWKTAMLLALTRPSRSADLSQLSLIGKQYKPEGVAFIPSGLAKQSRQGKTISEFFSLPSHMILICVR